MPRSTAPWDRAVWAVAVIYLAGALTAAAVLWMLSDRWWVATTLLFGPRWVLLVPLAGLVPAMVLKDRQLLALLAVASLILIGPVMGMRIGWRRLIVRPDPSRDITVASLNAMGGEALTKSTVELLHDWGADIAAVQECGSDYARTLTGLLDWHTDTTSTVCLISRFPILDVIQMSNEGLREAGGAGVVVTALLDIDGARVFVTNIHLETPRAGLERIRAGQLISGASTLRGKSALREIELRRARRWVDQFDGPHIVAGDFNTPAESPIYRAAWSDWQNGFSRVGRGFGGTRWNGWIRARIDHVLANTDWIPLRAWNGDNVGSDHVAMIARLRLATKP